MALKKNNRVVTIRENRECDCCNETILKGSKAFTFFPHNQRGERLPFRSWKCLSCHSDNQEKQKHNQIMDGCELGWGGHKNVF